MEEKDRLDSSVSSGAARYNTFLSYDDKKTNNELMDASKYWNKGHIQRIVKDKYVVVAGQRGREHEYLINEKKLPRPEERKTNPSTKTPTAVIGEEILSERQFTEGKAIPVLVNRYERDKLAMHVSGFISPSANAADSTPKLRMVQEFSSSTSITPKCSQLSAPTIVRIPEQISCLFAQIATQ